MSQESLESTPPPTPVNAVNPQQHSAEEGDEKRKAVIVPPKVKPPKPGKEDRCHCKPDQTPWWKYMLELAIFLVGAYVAYIYFGQLQQMIDSNQINRDSLQDVQRAFLSFDSILTPTITYRDSTGKEFDSIRFSIKMVNSGNTPAITDKQFVAREWGEPTSLQLKPCR